MAKQKVTVSANGVTPVAITSNRPSWVDMKKNYPADGVDRYAFFPRISKALALSADADAYVNTCALRMSYALNHSGVKLGKAPRDGSILGDDKLNYWLRVKDLRKLLMKLYGKPDVHLSYPDRMPDPLLSECDLVNRECDVNEYVKNYPDEYKARLDYANDNFMSKAKGKNGIIVFDVRGWGDATGHFTLWEDGDLLFVGENTDEKDPSSPSYYVWYTDPRIKYLEDVAWTAQTVEVHFWELKLFELL